ncbi:lantibiotic dehydratase [Actinomadura craniellae]|uniref:Lantibiotic dehydratase n=1 Tax=Actinomadura craniellae TaxID=2231787 RepID=A0A365H8S2_9ACTN|nr:lantibiotic dehydratase [Actinomadura craniellae]
MAVARRFRHAGLVLVRATTCPPEVVPPGGLDLADLTAVDREGATWLARVWAHREVYEAVEMASPALAARIDHLLAVDRPSERKLRRAAESVASYLLRWERRATPFGMFAGVTTGALGPAAAKIGADHRLVVRADAEWLADLIDQVESDRALRERLTVVADNTGTVRDGCLLVSRRAKSGARSPGPLREASVRLTTPIGYALDQATTPLRFDVLAERVSRRFPGVTTDRIHRLLHGLVDGGFLITNLRPPSTVEDPLDHLIQALRAAGVHETGTRELARTLDRLEEIGARLVQHNTTADRARAATLRAAAADAMRSMAAGTGHVLAADLRLDARIVLPEQVMEEAERAADVLLRLSAQPFGTAAWMDYHARFRARYGLGALVPVRDLLADSGLGYPHGYLGAPRARPAWRMLTERDAALLSMIQRAVVDGAEEITLTDADVRALTVGDHTRVVVPPRVELGVALHATSPEAIDRGDFELQVVAAPRAHTSMIGRFAHLLDEADRARLARTYAPGDGEVVAAQLSFSPRRPHNDNVVRVPPHAGTVALSLAEHPGGHGHGGIDLEDLAVTADADQLYLVQRSTGRRVVAHSPHALDTTVQTPPLARFLAEVADARSVVFGPVDLGAARTLPYVPRLRYRRTVLSPARWLLTSGDLATVHGDQDAGLRGWRDRWKVPARLVLCQAELRLPVNLDQPLDRRLLCAHLEKAGQIELREDAPPGGLGWVGRAAELVIPMVATAAPPRRPPITAPPGPVHQPGDAVLLRAHLVGNPAWFDAILTRHLPTLVGELGAPIRRWWAGRHRDLIRLEADQYLVVLLRLTDRCRYGPVAARLAAFTDDLRARGLTEQLMLAPAAEHPGRYGHGPALEAAEEVFATDTAAAIAQITMVEVAGVPGQAVAAASMAQLAAAFAADPASGHRALTRHLEQGSGPLDREVRDQALHLADPTSDFAAVRALPGGEAVAAAWRSRATALATYHRLLARQRDPAELLATLLHEHHVRALGPDPAHEVTTGRLARAAALRTLATAPAPAAAEGAR